MDENIVGEVSRRDMLASAFKSAGENDGKLPDDFSPIAKDAVVANNEDGLKRQEVSNTIVHGNNDVIGDAGANGKIQKVDAKDVNDNVQATPRPNAPKSWAAEHREHWDKLDPKIAAYINQREEEQARGVEPLKKVWQGLAPHLDLIQSKGLTPEYVVKDLLDTAVSLDRAAPQDKLAIWMRVGQSYGVPIHLLQQMQQQAGQQGQQQISPEQLALMQRVQGLEGYLTQQQQAQQAQMQNQIESEIAEFSKSEDHPHFEALRETMGNLLQAGIASDLATAYSKAVRLHDDIFQQDQATQRQIAEQKSKEEKDKAAKAAKANAVSTRTATPGSVSAATGTAPKGRRAMLEDAFSSVRGGRI